MSFSATEAAFEGFRVVRRHPVVAAAWGLVYLVMFLAMFGPFAGQWASMMAALEAMQESGEPSFADMEALGQSYRDIFLWLTPVMLVLGAVLNAAVARAVLRPEQSAWGYLRLGMDEVRVLVVTVAVGLITGLAAAFSFGIVGVIFGVGAAGGQAVLFLLGLVLILGAIALVVWLAVKLSLAVPITVDQGRIAIGESFAATKGRFWPLLGMAVIAFVMFVVVSLLGTVILKAVELAVGSVEGLARFDGLGTIEVLARSWPALLVWSVVNGLLSALQLAVLYAPFSAAWRDIRNARAA